MILPLKRFKQPTNTLEVFTRVRDVLREGSHRWSKSYLKDEKYGDHDTRKIFSTNLSGHLTLAGRHLIKGNRERLNVHHLLTLVGLDLGVNINPSYEDSLCGVEKIVQILHILKNDVSMVLNMNEIKIVSCALEDIDEYEWELDEDQQKLYSKADKILSSNMKSCRLCDIILHTNIGPYCTSCLED